MKFKYEKWLLVIAFILSNLLEVALATLIDRGTGMIYDDVLDITWLQDANYAKTSGYITAHLKNDPGPGSIPDAIYDNVLADGRMGWDAANTWVNQLYYGGYADWRLPNATPVNGLSFDYNLSFDGSTDIGYNIKSTNSEMSYMFYQNLGNLGIYDSYGSPTIDTVPDCCPFNPGPFKNIDFLGYSLYWSAVESAPNSALMFDGYDGPQAIYNKSSELHAWAVRSGDVANVPIPAISWIFGSALLGLLGLPKQANSI